MNVSGEVSACVTVEKLVGGCFVFVMDKKVKDTKKIVVGGNIDNLVVHTDNLGLRHMYEVEGSGDILYGDLVCCIKDRVPWLDGSTMATFTNIELAPASSAEERPYM